MLKMESMRQSAAEHNKKYRCCLCFHVRWGTAIIGAWHLVFQLMVLLFISFALFSPRLLEQLADDEFADGKIKILKMWLIEEYNETEPLPTVLKEIPVPTEEVATDLPEDGTGSSEQMWKASFNSLPLNAGSMSYGYDFKMGNTYRTENLHAAAAVTLCTVLVTALLLYGVCRGKAGYLVPFFCLQVFDLTLTTLTMVGYMSYIPNFRDYLTSNLSSTPENETYRKYVDDMTNECLFALCLMVALIIIMVKVYLMSVVWSCYRYLCHRAAQRAVSRVYMCGGEEGRVTKKDLLPPPYSTLMQESDQVSYKLLDPPAYCDLTHSNTQGGEGRGVPEGADVQHISQILLF